jgi:hypothetical protein
MVAGALANSPKWTNPRSPGRMHGGGTCGQQLHGSPVPVGIASQGSLKLEPATIKPTVVAYQPASQSGHGVDVALRALGRVIS